MKNLDKKTIFALRALGGNSAFHTFLEWVNESLQDKRVESDRIELSKVGESQGYRQALADICEDIELAKSEAKILDQKEREYLRS